MPESNDEPVVVSTEESISEETGSKANGNIDRSERSWWFNKDDNSFKGTNKNGPAFGFDESLHLIENVWKTQGPFQGLLGFSQGACFAGLICSLSARGSKITDINKTIICDFIN